MGLVPARLCYPATPAAPTPGAEAPHFSEPLPCSAAARPARLGPMSARPPREEISLGPACLHLRPASPLAWEPESRAWPGPAGLALALLGRRLTGWSGVAHADGRAARPEAAAVAALPAAMLGGLLGALCPPWLSPEFAAELEALAAHLRGRADFPGLDCAACADQEARGEGAPDCGHCPLPPAPAAARPALMLHPLLARLPGGAAAWLPAFTAGLTAEERRVLGLRLALIAAILAPRPAGDGLPASPQAW